MAQLLSDNLDLPANRMRLLVVALGLVAVAIFNGGCERPRTTVAKSEPQENPAETDFEWAMQRLRRAIENFTPSGDLHLRVKREFSYELLPPTDSQPLYTAKVTVVSVSKFKPQRQQPTADEAPKRDRLADLRHEEGIFGEDSLLGGEDESPTTLYENDLNTPTKKTTRVEPLIKAPSLKEQQVYDLIYKKRRWQLVSQPEAKYEQLWFEYALQQ